MSFLSALKKQKNKLKETETVVTRVDGQRYIEGNQGVTLKPNTYGFVVDTKPDKIPVSITNHLYIGSQDCADEKVLEEYNIKNVLSLGIEAYVSVNHLYIPMLDLPETDVKPVLAQCLSFIRRAVMMKENVLVHCNAGVSRTATVAIAYLMHYEGLQFEDAYNLVKEKRPAVQPNAGFVRQLKGLTPGELFCSSEN